MKIIKKFDSCLKRTKTFRQTVAFHMLLTFQMFVFLKLIHNEDLQPNKL